MSLISTKSSFVLAAILLTFGGCNTGKVTSTTQTPGNPSAAGGQVKDATSDDVLASALVQLRPENFGINSTTEKPVSLLNSWRFKQLEVKGAPEAVTPVTAPEGWTSPEKLAWASQAKFDIEDAIHVRDGIFFRAIAGYLSDRGRDELHRVNATIDFVCRNVALWKDDEIELPFVPYFALHVGKGSVKDRAWLAAEILRQMRIDSVIVRGKSEAKLSNDKWLFGVILDQQVYLYDLRLGVAVFGGSITPASVAKLSEVPTHPEWLNQMSTSAAYRISAESLKEPVFFAIATPGFWCPRMQRLEQSLPPSDSCVVYDPVQANQQESSQLQRLSMGTGVPIDEIRLWPHPGIQIEGATHPTPEIARETQQLIFDLSAPIPVKSDGSPTGAPGENKLQRYRTEHLMGQFAESTKKYLSIRHLEVEAAVPEIARLNRAAAEDAFYWTILCKFESGEYPSAIELSQAYLKKYDHKGKWYFPARTLLAQSFAASGDLPKAISSLERSSSNDPNRDGNALRVKWWSSTTTATPAKAD